MLLAKQGFGSEVNLMTGSEPDFYPVIYYCLHVVGCVSVCDSGANKLRRVARVWSVPCPGFAIQVVNDFNDLRYLLRRPAVFGPARGGGGRRNLGGWGIFGF